MQVDPQSALRGVRSRLVGAVMAASVTLICVLYAMFTSLSSFGATFALTMGICSFGAAVALLLSARHEEEVHELAFQFNEPPGAQISGADISGAGSAHTGAADTEAPADSKPRALPEPQPNPLEDFNRVERQKVLNVSQRDLSGHTDGAL